MKQTSQNKIYKSKYAARASRLTFMAALMGLVLFATVEWERSASDKIAAFLLNTETRTIQTRVTNDLLISRRTIRQQALARAQEVSMRIATAVPPAGQQEPILLVVEPEVIMVPSRVSSASSLSSATASRRAVHVISTSSSSSFASSTSSSVPFLQSSVSSVPANSDVSLHSVSPNPPLNPSPPPPPIVSVLPENVQTPDAFPRIEHTAYPVTRVPNWGAMRTPAQWDRSYKEMTREDMVALPRYDLKALTIPVDELVSSLTAENISVLTAKLFYSTRYYGAYDLDAREFTGAHPGIDLKLARGTPIGAIGGGRVHTVTRDTNMGLYVMIEHRLVDGTTFFSIYGHLDSTWVKEGEDARPGQGIGSVGMTGNTTAPHVHLQVDRDDGVRPHIRYWPTGIPSSAEADTHTINPIRFIGQYTAGE